MPSETLSSSRHALAVEARKPLYEVIAPRRDMRHVECFYDRPMLETAGWDYRRAPEGLVLPDRWGTPCALVTSTDAREGAVRPHAQGGEGEA